jgi:hypothetical protein
MLLDPGVPAQARRPAIRSKPQEIPSCHEIVTFCVEHAGQVSMRAVSLYQPQKSLLLNEPLNVRAFGLRRGTLDSLPSIYRFFL